MSDRVRVEVRGRHARLTFDDGRMNLLSHHGLGAISEAFESIHQLLDLFLNNGILDAEQAAAAGLVHEVDADPGSLNERLLRICERRPRLLQLKILASKRKNLSSLALHANRLHTLHELARTDRRNGVNGHSRNPPRSIFR